MSRWATGSCSSSRGRRGATWQPSSLTEDEREQRGERQVDEVGRLDQTDGQEELTGQLALGLGLAGDSADERVTGDTVTDTGADGAAAQSEATADQTAGGLDGAGVISCGHVLVSPSD